MIHDRLCDLSDRAEKLTATTQEAFRAKAILLQHAMRVECESDGVMEFSGAADELALSLLSDLTGRA